MASAQPVVIDDVTIDDTFLHSLWDEAEELAETPGAVVNSDPERIGGTPAFTGTRVPVDNLFDYLESGDGLAEFLDDFPSVRPAQAVAALKIARKALRRVALADAD